MTNFYKPAQAPDAHNLETLFLTVTALGVAAPQQAGSVKAQKDLALGLDRGMNDIYRQASELKKRNDARLPRHTRHDTHSMPSYANGFRRR